MNENENSTNLWINFFPAWIIANGLGWSLVSAVFILPFWGLWAVIAVSFFIGLFQWLALQKYIGVDSTWVWMSIFTYGVFLYILFLSSAHGTFFTFFIIDVVCFGLLSLFQRSTLAHFVNRSAVWVIASPFANIISNAMSIVLINQIAPKSLVIFWGLWGIFYGCITGMVIVLLWNSTFLWRK